MFLCQIIPIELPQCLTVAGHPNSCFCNMQQGDLEVGSLELHDVA